MGVTFRAKVDRGTLGYGPQVRASFSPQQVDITATAKLPDHKWRIIHLKGAKTIGYVEAPDAQTAIKQAIEEFKIEPAIRGRLVAENEAKLP
jgi:hypothetical protein